MNFPYGVRISYILADGIVANEEREATYVVPHVGYDYVYVYEFTEQHLKSIIYIFFTDIIHHR